MRVYVHYVKLLYIKRDNDAKQLTLADTWNHTKLLMLYKNSY